MHRGRRGRENSIHICNGSVGIWRYQKTFVVGNAPGQPSMLKKRGSHKCPHPHPDTSKQKRQVFLFPTPHNFHNFETPCPRAQCEPRASDFYTSPEGLLDESSSPRGQNCSSPGRPDVAKTLAVIMCHEGQPFFVKSRLRRYSIRLLIHSSDGYRRMLERCYGANLEKQSGFGELHGSCAGVTAADI